MMSCNMLPTPNASILVLIIIFVASSNAIDSVSGQGSNSEGHQSKELGQSHNGQAFKTKVSPTQEAEMALTRNDSPSPSSMLGIDFPLPDEEYLYRKRMVLMDDSQSNDPEAEMLLSGCDGDFDHKCRFAYLFDKYGVNDQDILEPIYGQKEISLGFQSVPAPSKRRLRFVKRRLRFVKRDEDKETSSSSSSSMDKRRLRFVKKDDEEENSISKRRLRFVKRRLRFHKRNYADFYPSASDDFIFPDYEDSLSLTRANPGYYGLVQKEQKSDDFIDDDTNSQKHSLGLPRLYSSGGSHIIKRRSAPSSPFPELESLGLGLEPTLAKRSLSISQPLQLLSNMVVAREREQRLQEQRDHLSKLSRLGKRADLSTPQNDNSILSNVLAKFVQAYLDRPKEKQDYLI